MSIPFGIKSVWLAALLVILFYSVVAGAMVRFLRPVTFGLLDPVNVQILLFTSPAIMGVILVPFLTGNYSDSYFTILLFLSVWLLVMRCSGRARFVDLSDSLDPDFQVTLLVLCAAITVANIVINMILPGTIPLFTEGGVYTRFDAGQNSRLLSWFSLGTTPMAGLIYAVSQRLRIRRLAAGVVLFQAAAGLLSASKGAILAILFVLLNAMFVAKMRGESARYRSMRKIFVYVTVVVGCFAPLYFAVIGFGPNGNASSALGARFLEGFDQLIFTSQFDLLKGHGSGPLLPVNLIEYQLMPIFKSVFSAKYIYSSVGQYVVSSVTGIYVEGPATFPNSNLILETIFTSGVYLGMAAFITELACFYVARLSVMRRPVRPFSLVLLAGMVFNPFGLFLSGQEWITSIEVMILTVGGAMVLAALWRAARQLLLVSFPRQARV